MFQDEARFGRISDVRRCWAPKPVRPLCQAMLTHEYTYAYGAVDVCTGELDSLILPHVNTQCMQVFLNEVSARHPQERIIMVIDGAGWHRSDHPTRPNSIRLSTYGTSCAKSSSTTGSSTAWTLWKITWNSRSKRWKTIPAQSTLSSLGPGLLKHLLLH
jgi:hypothetical protein